MTSKEYDKLDPVKQKVLVAFFHTGVHWAPILHEISYIQWSRNGVSTTDKPRDYLNDLNAMHEAEKFLISKGALPTYEHYLDMNQIEGEGPWYGPFNATASQRAKAFVLTMSSKDVTGNI